MPARAGEQWGQKGNHLPLRVTDVVPVGTRVPPRAPSPPPLSPRPLPFPRPPVSDLPSPSPSPQECGVTPDSENLTLSSSGGIDQSSCTGTPLSSTISSPEGTQGSRGGPHVLPSAQFLRQTWGSPVNT